jgi:hypothetical protein
LGALVLFNDFPVSLDFDLGFPGVHQLAVDILKELLVGFLGLALDGSEERAVEYPGIGVGEGRCRSR